MKSPDVIIQVTTMEVSDFGDVLKLGKWFRIQELSILHHLLNVFVQLANKRGFTKKKKKKKELSVSCLLHEFKLPPTFLGYLTGHRRGSAMMLT
jgi:hypothetical protein